MCILYNMRVYMYIYIYTHIHTHVYTMSPAGSPIGSGAACAAPRPQAVFSCCLCVPYMYIYIYIYIYMYNVCIIHIYIYIYTCLSIYTVFVQRRKPHLRLTGAKSGRVIIATAYAHSESVLRSLSHLSSCSSVYVPSSLPRRSFPRLPAVAGATGALENPRQEPSTPRQTIEAVGKTRYMAKGPGPVSVV